MPTLTMATLCGAASFRNGLLSVLDSGLERLDPASYPALFVPTLAVRIDFDEADFDTRHEVRIDVTHQDGEKLSSLDLSTTYEPPTEESVLALTNYWMILQPLPLQIRRDGIYHVSIHLGAKNVRTLRFRSALPAQ
ncbi:MAG: hypothetical protein CL424_14310 [Acidimicrobiaceae bacterium]|nr:hypothetical protein [Acidimicrobiaceae bacterium]